MGRVPHNLFFGIYLLYKTILFQDRSRPPTEHQLREHLGHMHEPFLELPGLAEDFSQVWKYPGKKHGWLLKVSGTSKALFWLTPMEGTYRIGYNLREAQLITLKESKSPPVIQEALRHAVRYPEGYGLFFLVSDPALHQDVLQFTRQLISLS